MSVVCMEVDMYVHVTYMWCRHVSQLDKPSKRYRNVHADVFVIADDDDNGAYCVCLCVRTCRGTKH